MTDPASACPPPPGPLAASTSGRMRVAALVLLLAAGLLALGAHLGPVTSTETRYAESGREMAESGDWVIPTLNGGPLLEKPPLVYWTEALGFLVLGVGDVSARVPNVLAALGVLLLVAVLVRRVGPGGGRGTLAALALATCPAFLVLAYVISHDVGLVLATTAAGTALFACLHEARRPRLRWVLLLHAALGVGMLAKGPVVLALVAAPALVVGLLRRETRLLRALGHPVGLGLLLALSVPWYLAANARIPGLLQTLVQRRLFGALSSSTDFHSRPPYLLLLAVVGTLPWLGALPTALRALWRRSPASRDVVVLGAALIATPFLLFAFSASVLPSYAAPVIPWIVLLIVLGAPVAGEAGRGWHRGLRIGCVLLPVGAVLGVTVVARLERIALDAWLWSAIAVGVVGLAIALVPSRRIATPTRAAAVVLCVLAVAAVTLVGVPAAVGSEGELWPPLASHRKPGEALGAWLRANDSWGFLPWKAREPVVYFGYPSHLVVEPPEKHAPQAYRPRSEVGAWLSSPERRWLMLRVKDHPKLKVPVWIVSRGPKYEIVTNQPFP